MNTVKINKESISQILETLLKRSPNSYGEYEETVNNILNDIRANRDEALFSYTEKFDGVKLNALNIKNNSSKKVEGCSGDCCNCTTTCSDKKEEA